MKKLTIFLFAIICVAPFMGADAAVQIKKAAAVSSSSASDSNSATSLVPTVIGLVSGVMEMNAKQNALTDECIPSTAEVTFIDNTMKEWARTGQATAKEIEIALARQACAPGIDCYTNESRTSAPGMKIKYNTFGGIGSEFMVWDGFPKVGKAVYCKDGSIPPCSDKNKVTTSDAYDLFALIDFGPADYTIQETTMAARLLNKQENCSSAKLSAKKKALWGEFLVNTAGSLGKKTNTGSIMDQVGAMSGSGAMGAVGSLGSIATQFMNK